MNRKHFDKLIDSIKEAGRIRRRGEQRPSRVYEFRPAAVKVIRARLRKS